MTIVCLYGLAWLFGENKFCWGKPIWFNESTTSDDISIQVNSNISTNTIHYVDADTTDTIIYAKFDISDNFILPVFGSFHKADNSIQPDIWGSSFQLFRNTKCATDSYSF